jgi:hypothetical protein
VLSFASRRGDPLAELMWSRDAPDYGRLRARGPIHMNPFMAGTVSYAAANEILRSSDFGVGDRLDDIELHALGLLLLAAGFETTVNLLGNAVADLDAHPDQRALILADPSRVDGVVEETLLWAPPVMATVREAYADTSVAAVDVAKGTAAAVVLGGANRATRRCSRTPTRTTSRANADLHVSGESRTPPHPHPSRLRIPPRRTVSHGVLLLLRHPPGVRSEASGGRIMGSGQGEEIAVDYIALGQVRKDLNAEKDNVVAARDAMIAPAAGMFGDSADGKYLFGLVKDGHKAIADALTESETAMTRMDEGIEIAVKELEGADAQAEAAALVIRKFVEATQIMSNPLVLLNKDTLAKARNLPI